MHYNFDTITDSEIDKQVNELQQFHSAMLQGVKVNPAKKMLEIGPGGGFALKAFSNMGYNVTGLETSTSATAFMQNRLGLNVINSSIEMYLPDENGRFDLILLNHVLEHFLDPNESMKKLAAMLTPGGILYIRVPDHDSYDRKAYGKNWPAYAQYHISNFSEASLVLLQQKFGLNVLQVKKFISAQSPGYVKWVSKIPGFHHFLSKKHNGRTITTIAILYNKNSLKSSL
jgi:2-polyprenyl-3-methyl-5-hydroxy-6-metoxy-1,4-benzoquinol methylase